jgi:hypothetical protein
LIDHSSCLGKKIKIKGCLVISVHDVDSAGVLGRLAGFRREFHRCLTARPDALFELTDALLCGDAPVRRWSSCRWPVNIGGVTARCMLR